MTADNPFLNKWLRTQRPKEETPPVQPTKKWPPNSHENPVNPLEKGALVQINRAQGYSREEAHKLARNGKASLTRIIYED